MLFGASMYTALGGTLSGGDFSPVRLHTQRRKNTVSPLPQMRAGSPSTPLRPSRTLEPLPLQADRPSSGSDASQVARSAQINPPTVRRFFFSANGLDKHSKKLPAAHHYDVLLEDGDGTEGPNLQDEIQCRYIDFLAAAAGGDITGLSWTNPSLNDVMKVAEFLDRCAPRTRLDGYPLYIILKDVLRRLLRGQIEATSQAEAELRAQVASLQSSLGAAAASHMMLQRQFEQLRGRLQTIEQQLGDLASQETGMRERLWASTNELAQASAELAESQTELEGNGEGATAKFGGLLRQIASTGSIADSFSFGRGNSDDLATGTKGSAADGGSPGVPSAESAGAGSAGSGVAGSASSEVAGSGVRSARSAGSAVSARSGDAGSGTRSAESGARDGVGGQIDGSVADSDTSSRRSVSPTNFASIGAALGAVALGTFGGASGASKGSMHGGGSGNGSGNGSGSSKSSGESSGKSSGVPSGRLSGMVSGVISTSHFTNSSNGSALHESGAALAPSEVDNLVQRLPPNAIESLMVSALESAPKSNGNGAVQTGMFRALVASGHVDADAIRDAVPSLSAEQRQKLLRELWEEFGGPHDRTTIHHLHDGIGIGPDDISRMIAEGWDDWGSRFLMSLLHRVGSDPVELLQGVMRELAPRKAAATEAVVDMADGIRDQLSDATNSVADAFSASWGGGTVMGRDVKDGVSSLVSDLESQAGNGSSAIKLRALKALSATLELGDSSASDAFLSLVAAGDSIGVGRFLMKAIARDISGEDLGDANAGSKMRKEDFAKFVGQTFGNGDTPDAVLMSDIGDQLAGNGSGVDLNQFENIVLPSDSVDGDSQFLSSSSNGSSAAKGSTLKMGLWMGSAGRSSGNGNGNGSIVGSTIGGSRVGGASNAAAGGAVRCGREVGTQTIAGQLSGNDVDTNVSSGNDSGRLSTEISTGTGDNRARSSVITEDRRQDTDSSAQVSGRRDDGGSNGSRGRGSNGSDDHDNHGTSHGTSHGMNGDELGLHRDQSSEAVLGNVDAATKEREKQLLLKRNKSLA
eukprot:COSAG02_NODE_2823_length_7948_cov_14.628105_1_plen_1034_part_10